MTSPQIVRLVSSNNLDKKSESPGLIHHTTPNERLRLSFKKFGIFWGIAIGCIFIPVFHFVLVPLFFILGLYFGPKELKVTTCIDQADAKCPECSANIPIKKMYLTPPSRDQCKACSDQYNIYVV